MPSAARFFRRGLPVAAALTLLAVVSGCSNRTVVGRATGDFTAYYNAFYNARKSFDAGVTAMNQTRLPVTRGAYLAVYPPSQGAAAASFDGAVRKAADVLRKHPGSRWTDDALLLIGQSYYHMGQYAAAEQKFREVIVEWRGRGGQTSDLADDARLWLARTLVASQRPQVTADFFAQTFSQEATLSAGELARLRLVRADFHVTQGRWEDAATDLRTALPNVRDSKLRARAAFLLGQVEETQEHYREARAAFEQAVAAEPEYELAVAARIGAYRMTAAAGDRESALRGLASMISDERNAEMRADLSRVRARLLADAGRRDEARDLLLRTLRGQDRDLSAQRGLLYYTMADLYRRGYGDYVTAAVYYDSAATALPAPGTTPPRGSLTTTSTREAVLDAADRRQVFSDFAAARRRTLEADSLLRIGALDDASFARFVRSLREARAREQATAQRAAAAAAEAQAFGGALGGEGGLNVPGMRQPTPGAPGASSSEAGFLFYRDPSRVRANRLAFQQVWGNRPLVPNWRRRSAITGAGAVELAASQQLQADGTVAAPGEEGLPEVDVSAIPRTDAARTRVRAARAEARYALANAFFLRLNEPDSARSWLRRIVEEDPEAPIAPRALYALAELEQVRGDTAAANLLYAQTLERYPDLDFADRVRERLGQPPVARLDSTAEGQAAYAAAYTAADSAGAFQRFLGVAARYRGQAAGAQALLAASQVFLRDAAGDTLALAAPLPADSALLVQAGLRPDSAGVPLTLPHLFRAIADTYAGTAYAERARATLAVLTGASATAPVAPPADGDVEDETVLERRRRQQGLPPGQQPPPPGGQRPGTPLEREQ